MSGRWWRAYSRARHDPKLLKLTDKDFRWWFNLICVASDNDGKLPYLRDLAAEFRTTEHVIAVAIERLRLAGLFDIEGEPGPDVRYIPHNWNGLQYKSDVSNERVKRFRERQGNVTRNVTVTPSESESESESESDTETEQKREGAQALPRTGSRLPEDWQPSDEDRVFAKQFSSIDIEATAAVFRDYWHGVAGAKGRKADWAGTWRNWVRREVTTQKPAPRAYPPPSTRLPPEEPWEQRVTGWVKARQWVPQLWGPAPGQTGCRAPPQVIHQVTEAHRP